MQEESGASEHRRQKSGERLRDFAELRKDEDLFLPGLDGLDDLAQALEFPAVAFGPLSVAEPLRWMIADLLEAHQKREDHAASLDAFINLFQASGQFLHRLLI